MIEIPPAIAKCSKNASFAYALFGCQMPPLSTSDIAACSACFIRTYENMSHKKHRRTCTRNNFAGVVEAVKTALMASVASY